MIVSYAQNFEDVILWRALKGVGSGFYIDIGANDPKFDSVSRLFYEQSWRGVHVEPVSRYAEVLRAARPDEVVIQTAVGASPGVLTFFEVKDSGLSTGNVEIAQQHRSNGCQVVETTVPCLTLGSLLDSCNQTEVHWLKIDVEGMEKDVIEGWLPSTVRPWIVVIESTKPLSTEPSHESFDHLVVDLGYEMVYFDGLNRFYISVGHKELKQAFGPGPNVFDDFVLTSQSKFCEPLRSEIEAAEGKVRDYIGRLSDLERNHFELAFKVDRLRSDVETLWSDVETLSSQLAAAIERLERIQKSSSWVITTPWRIIVSAVRQLGRCARRILWRIAFHSNGRPRKPVRGILFRKKGAPRKWFRRIVFHKDGRPTRAFEKWLSSNAQHLVRNRYSENVEASDTLEL